MSMSVDLQVDRIPKTACHPGMYFDKQRENQASGSKTAIIIGATFC